MVNMLTNDQADREIGNALNDKCYQRKLIEWVVDSAILPAGIRISSCVDPNDEYVTVKCDSRLMVPVSQSSLCKALLEELNSKYAPVRIYVDINEGTICAKAMVPMVTGCGEAAVFMVDKVEAAVREYKEKHDSTEGYRGFVPSFDVINSIGEEMGIRDLKVMPAAGGGFFVSGEGADEDAERQFHQRVCEALGIGSKEDISC